MTSAHLETEPSHGKHVTIVEPEGEAMSMEQEKAKEMAKIRRELYSKFRKDCLDAEKLTFVAHLGAGEYGKVDKYNYTDSNGVTQALAIKVLNSDVLTNPKDVLNFVNEMRTIKQLDHPCIASYVGTGVIEVENEAGSKEEHVFMAQECCEGDTLQDLLLKQMKMKPTQQAYKWSEVVAWMIGVCSGLQYMHGNKPMIIHRDLKPANIIIKETADGTKVPKLIDFGLHKVIHLHSDESIRGGTTQNSWLSRSLAGSRHGGSMHGSAASSRNGSVAGGGIFGGQKAGISIDLRVLQDGGVKRGRNGSIHARNGYSTMADQAFKMTGGCGSLIYMAPEVHMGQDYNQTVDTFSIALIFWELFAFRMQLTLIDFAGQQGETFQAVNHYTMDIVTGSRPPLPKIWPKNLRALFSDMWAHDLSERPSFAEVVTRLKEIQVTVEELEAKGKCPHFMGILPGMKLAMPKAKKPSFVKKMKSLFK